MDAVTGRYCLKQINRAEGRDLRLDVSKLFRISSVGPWSTCLLTCTKLPAENFIKTRWRASASCASRADPTRRGRWRRAGERQGEGLRHRKIEFSNTRLARRCSRPSGTVCNHVPRPANVRFGSKADMCSAQADVRFTPKSGHVQCTGSCPLCAKSSQTENYSLGPRNLRAPTVVTRSGFRRGGFIRTIAAERSRWKKGFVSFGRPMSSLGPKSA